MSTEGISCKFLDEYDSDDTIDDYKTQAAQ
jgi:hypothetical protein